MTFAYAPAHELTEEAYQSLNRRIVRSKRKNARAIASGLSFFAICGMIVGIMMFQQARVDAQFECTSAGMNAYMAGDTDGALAFLGEANKARFTGKCEGQLDN